MSSYMSLRGCSSPKLAASSTPPARTRKPFGNWRAFRAQFPSPEEINDDPNTAPSRRILEALPDYVKKN